MLWLFPSTTKAGSITHLTRQRFAQILKDLAVASGVDPESVSAHKLRHTFASKLLENGSDIKTLQSMLGHTSLSSTQVYAKLQKSSDETFLESHPLTEEEK